MVDLLRIKMSSDIRPVIQVPTLHDSLNCLIDTGANINVFILGYMALKQYFPYSELVSRKSVKLSGFGKGEVSADLYCIDSLKLQSDIDTDYIVFKNVYVACCFRNDLGATLILAYGTFDFLDITFANTLDDKREFQIKHDLNEYKGEYTKDSRGLFVKRTHMRDRKKNIILSNNDII